MEISTNITYTNFNYHLQSFYKILFRLSKCCLDQAFKNAFHQRLESIQYDNVVAILETLEERPRKSYIKNLVLSHSNPENTFENHLYFTK